MDVQGNWVAGSSLKGGKWCQEAATEGGDFLVLEWAGTAPFFREGHKSLAGAAGLPMKAPEKATQEVSGGFASFEGLAVGTTQH